MQGAILTTEPAPSKLTPLSHITKLLSTLELAARPAPRRLREAQPMARGQA